MLSQLITPLGGLGLFLLGMIILTDGLKALAGQNLRSWLMRATRSPLTGALGGAAVTAIVQSSSITTVTAVGFVNAGLIRFSEAIGIVYGANIGTTVTGWLVVVLGFKLKIGAIMLPLVLCGVLLKLFGRGHLQSAGLAVAGFGLIFVGIGTLQEGMQGLQGFFDLSALPADSWRNRLYLVGFGLGVTMVTQSSSAGVAAALSALFGGLITFPQAAALVIGMDIGTTVTALLSSIGGSVAARRTAVSHTAFNCTVATFAFFFVDLYPRIWEAVAPGALAVLPGIALVAFHSTNNILGVCVFLPFTRQFAGLIERFVPDRQLPLSGKLEESLLEQPGLALDVLHPVAQDASMQLLRHVARLLGDDASGRRIDLRTMERELDNAQQYLDRIVLPARDGVQWQRLLELVHALDHAQRLFERCDEDAIRADTAMHTETLREAVSRLRAGLVEVIGLMEQREWGQAPKVAETISDTLHDLLKQDRHDIIAAMAGDQVDVPTGTRQLEAIRWLRRVSRHVERISKHLAGAALAHGST